MIILITGGAGTGKTYLINKLKKEFPHLITSSTTWVSGKLIQSKTFYRELRITPKFFEDENLPIHYRIRKTILIDESSMLSRQQLLKLKKHFPRCHFILVGDFNQLPPVNGDMIKKEDVDEVYNLNVNHRVNSDIKLIGFLDRLLSGNLSNSDYIFIKEHTITEEESIENNMLQLTYTNENRLNYISKIETKYGVGQKLISRLYYTSDDTNNRIFCTSKNKWWVNNEIVEIVGKTNDYIKVKTYENIEQRIYNEDLIWWVSSSSLTCHKIQGQTINTKYVINLDEINKCRNPEQKMKMLYVSISRSTKLENIYFIGKFPHISPMINEFVPLWSGDNEDLFELIKNYDKEEKSVDFFLCNLINSKLVYKSIHNNNMTSFVNQPNSDIYISGFGNQSIDYEILTTRELGRLCNISCMMVSKLLKKGLSKKEIYNKYNPFNEETTDFKKELRKEIQILETKLNFLFNKQFDCEDDFWDTEVDDVQGREYLNKNQESYRLQYNDVFYELGKLKIINGDIKTKDDIDKIHKILKRDKFRKEMIKKYRRNENES